MVMAELLSDGKGETSVRPKPAPTSIRISVTTVATKAPAMTGPQLTAEEEDSTGGSTMMEEVGMAIAASYRKSSMRMMMTGIGTPSSQSRIPRPMGNLQCFKRLRHFA
jgi:hypothetical protein